MFDLFRSRQKMVRLMLGGILVVVSLSMLTYLVPSFNTGSSDPTDQVVAEIGKQKLMQDEVVKAIDRSVKGRQLPAGLMASYIPQMVNEMISVYALEYQAEKLGFQVSDAELQTTIRQLFPSLFPDGKFVGHAGAGGLDGRFVRVAVAAPASGFAPAERGARRRHGNAGRGGAGIPPEERQGESGVGEADRGQVHRRVTAFER